LTDADLLQIAQAAREHAYAPYSRFRVGAAVLADDGRVYSGCNVENAAYPQGVCAEAGALSAMVLGGARQARLIAIVAGPEGSLQPCLPCGGCRQKIAEFAGSGATVIIQARDGTPVRHAIGALLPGAFGPDDLVPG
jgi:cytidine deaminase